MGIHARTTRAFFLYLVPLGANFLRLFKEPGSLFLSGSSFAPPAVMMRPKLLHIWPAITGRALMFHTESQPFNDLGHRTHTHSALERLHPKH